MTRNLHLPYYLPGQFHGTLRQIPFRLVTPVFVFHLILLVVGTVPTVAQESHPAPFDPAETQHGFADFNTIPTLPSEDPPPQLPYYERSHTPPSMEDTPKGLFQEMTLAEDVEEDLEYRRGHLYHPVRPTEQFPSNTLGIYIVFRVFKHYTPYQIFAQLYPDHTPDSPKPDMLDEDIVFLATEDESGYLKLFPPGGGWTPGDYQVHIFVGFEANAVTRMGTLHFSIVTPS